jgi:hypothetical protein
VILLSALLEKDGLSSRASVSAQTFCQIENSLSDEDHSGFIAQFVFTDKAASDRNSFRHFLDNDADRLWNSPVLRVRTLFDSNFRRQFLRLEATLWQFFEPYYSIEETS